MVGPSLETPRRGSLWKTLARLQMQSAAAASGDDFRAARLSDVNVSLSGTAAATHEPDPPAPARARQSSLAASTWRASLRRSRAGAAEFQGTVDPLAWLRTKHVHESSDLPPFDLVVFIFQTLVHVLFPWSLPLYVLVAFIWLPKGFAIQATRVQGFIPLNWAAVPRTVLVEWLMPLVCQVR